jgi:MarR family transcriptional regulator, transcriptional regulator for hemolysin
MPKFSPEDAKTRFGSLIGAVYRQWRRTVDLSFKELGLSDATRAPLLELLVAGSPLKQKDLAQALYLDTSSLFRVLEQLRQMELLDWSADPEDRRTKVIALTDKGRKVSMLILEKSLAIEHEILSGLTAQELKITRASLEKISGKFGDA